MSAETIAAIVGGLAILIPLVGLQWRQILETKGAAVKAQQAAELNAAQNVVLGHQNEEIHAQTNSNLSEVRAQLAETQKLLAKALGLPPDTIVPESVPVAIPPSKMAPVPATLDEARLRIHPADR